MINSQDYLGTGTTGEWPPPDFTLAENLLDLQCHEADPDSCHNFTFTVLNPVQTTWVHFISVGGWPKKRTVFPFIPVAPKGISGDVYPHLSFLAETLFNFLLTNPVLYFKPINE